MKIGKVIKTCWQPLKRALIRRSNALGQALSGTADNTAIARAIRHYANPGPLFETAEAQSSSADSSGRALARVMAFYLPQFHRIPENDEWWGPGFTEWRNVARGTPRYEGHYQPRIPADLGHYDLTMPSVLEQQAQLALDNGINAFCFYYYRFNSKRLLEKPLDIFCEIDTELQFCLMWANENWTRTWDGQETNVLMQQDYHQEDEDDFLDDIARYMAHPRYVRIAGRPVYSFYRASLIPETAQTIARWRAKLTRILGVEPWFLMAQSFQEFDPRPYGLDGAIEFPPHKICRGVTDVRADVKTLDSDFTGSVRRYTDIMASSFEQPLADFPEIKTVAPSWDNDARREARGTSWQGSTPAHYEKWLRGAIDHAQAHPFAGEPVVCINAWNEWAEGAYLEPDVHFGHAYLNATRRAVYGL